jgi:hypothetical protein
MEHMFPLLFGEDRAFIASDRGAEMSRKNRCFSQMQKQHCLFWQLFGLQTIT